MAAAIRSLRRMQVSKRRNSRVAINMSMLIFNVSMLILFSQTVWAADARSTASSAGVSADFRSQYEQAAATIPQPIWKSLHAAGWRVRLAHVVSDAAPELRNVRPRGWPAGRSWDSVEAVHLPRARTLIIAEMLHTADGDWKMNARVAGVLRHEVGHAFDMLVGSEQQFLSAGNDFRDAYAHDIEGMNRTTRAALQYFLQNGAAGRQEAFAEAFAIELGGGSDNRHSEEFRRAFPQVMRIGQEAIEKFKAVNTLP